MLKFPRLWNALFVSLFLMLLQVADASAATTWYVAPSGDDSKDCMSITTPCKTIRATLTKAASTGDTINFISGMYVAEPIIISKTVTLSGGWNATFTTQDGMSVVDGEG